MRNVRNWGVGSRSALGSAAAQLSGSYWVYSVEKVGLELALMV
jgi:hypothetical protein